MSKYLSHLAHVEVYATDVEESVKFYTDKLGMKVVTRDAERVFLRCWGDYYAYSVVLRPGENSGLVRMAWRTNSAEDLDEAVARVEATDHAGKWLEPADGIGRSYEFTGPFGHTMQLFWDVELYKAEGDDASTYPDRPAKRSTAGIAPRQLDHVTIASRDIKGFAEWYRDVLGFRIMAYAQLPQPEILFFGVITTNEKSHDLGILLDASDVSGRIHHYAFWVDTSEQVTEGADVLTENGVPVEFGPGFHGIGEQNFLYFRDPSGLRIELNSGGYRNYIPDWKPNVWKIDQGPNDMFRNSTLPPSMLEASPPTAAPTATEQGVVPGTEAELAEAALRAHNDR